MNELDKIRITVEDAFAWAQDCVDRVGKDIYESQLGSKYPGHSNYPIQQRSQKFFTVYEGFEVMLFCIINPQPISYGLALVIHCLYNTNKQVDLNKQIAYYQSNIKESNGQFIVKDDTEILIKKIEDGFNSGLVMGPFGGYADYQSLDEAEDLDLIDIDFLDVGEVSDSTDSTDVLFKDEHSDLVEIITDFWNEGVKQARVLDESTDFNVRDKVEHLIYRGEPLKFNLGFRKHPTIEGFFYSQVIVYAWVESKYFEGEKTWDLVGHIEGPPYQDRGKIKIKELIDKIDRYIDSLYEGYSSTFLDLDVPAYDDLLEDSRIVDSTGAISLLKTQLNDLVTWGMHNLPFEGDSDTVSSLDRWFDPVRYKNFWVGVGITFDTDMYFIDVLLNVKDWKKSEDWTVALDSEDVPDEYKDFDGSWLQVLSIISDKTHGYIPNLPFYSRGEDPVEYMIDTLDYFIEGIEKKKFRGAKFADDVDDYSDEEIFNEADVEEQRGLADSMIDDYNFRTSFIESLKSVCIDSIEFLKKRKGYGNHKKNIKFAVGHHIINLEITYFGRYMAFIIVEWKPFGDLRQFRTGTFDVVNRVGVWQIERGFFGEEKYSIDLGCSVVADEVIEYIHKYNEPGSLYNPTSLHYDPDELESNDLESTELKGLMEDAMGDSIIVDSIIVDSADETYTSKERNRVHNEIYEIYKYGVETFMDSLPKDVEFEYKGRECLAIFDAQSIIRTLPSFEIQFYYRKNKNKRVDYWFAANLVYHRDKDDIHKAIDKIIDRFEYWIFNDDNVAEDEDVLKEFLEDSRVLDSHDDLRQNLKSMVWDAFKSDGVAKMEYRGHQVSCKLEYHRATKDSWFRAWVDGRQVYKRYHNERTTDDNDLGYVVLYIVSNLLHKIGKITGEKIQVFEEQDALSEDEYDGLIKDSIDDTKRRMKSLVREGLYSGIAKIEVDGHRISCASEYGKGSIKFRAWIDDDLVFTRDYSERTIALTPEFSVIVIADYLLGKLNRIVEDDLMSVEHDDLILEEELV